MKDSYPLYPITGDKQTKPRGGLTGMATGGSFLESLVETIPIAAPVVNALGFRKQVYDPAELPMDLNSFGQTDIKLMQDPLRSLPRSTQPKDLPAAIKAYRADPTGKFGGKEGLETRPIQRTYTGGDQHNPRSTDPASSNSYNDSSKAVQELYRHARLLGAAQKYGYPHFTPEEAAAFMLKEGRTDLGHGGVRFGNKREIEFDDMLKKTYNLHPEDQNFLAAINAKKLVADRLGISLAEAWNGTGRNEAGQTGKDYARNWEEQRKAALHPKNKELLDLINRAINEGKQHGLPLRENRYKDEIMQRREVPYADGGSVGGWHELTGGMAKGGKVKEPKNTVKAYKLFRVHEKHPGKLFPLFVDANTPVEMGKWVDAKEGEMANGKVKSKIGALAYRPGWHAGDLPIATHIGEKSDPSLTAPDMRPANHAWAEVEMPHDVDWQSIANERGTNAQGKLVPVKAHITDQIPVGGHYRYKTNPNMTGNWLIGGSMKVNRVLTDKEVEKINRAAGLADLPRAQPFKKKTYGFASGGVVAPDEWKAEEHVNHNISHKATGGSQEFPLQVPADNEEIKPHPKYSWLDKASQGVQAAHDFVSAPFGYENPPGEMVSKLLGVPAIAKTMENMAYGTPVTSGSGMTSNLRPETAEAALGVAPLVGPAVKTAKKVGKAVAPTVAEMAAELAEKGGAPIRQFAVPNEGKLSKEEYSRMMREKYAADNAAKAAKKEAAPATQEVKAPADNLGFYSGVEKAALNLQRKTGTGDDFIADLMKNPGVNQARLEEMGLDALKGRPNVTADEVRQLAAKNKPKLSETVRIEHDEAAIEELERRHDEILDYKHEAEAAGDRRSVANYEDELQENIAMQKRLKRGGEAKFGPKYHDNYNMPNGEDYREIRIKLPSNRPSLNNMSRAEYDAAVKKADSEGIKNFTHSTHHNDEENVLLHLRVKNHRDADGKNGLLIDELQSDWHQKGKKEGYLDKEYHQLKGGLTPEDRSRLAEIVNSPNWRFDEKMVADYNLLNKKAGIAERSNRRVPDAPFKENWYQLGLKRAIKEAADSGMQRVYLTTGKTQNERFALSKQVSEIHYTDHGTLYAYDKDGQLVLNEKIPKDKLPEYIGKEASQKLISQPAEGGNRVLAGVDMDVGGEGMKHWYDNQYINYLKKYANEHGAQVGMTKLPVTRIENHWPEFRDWFAKNHSDRGSSSTAHSYFTQGKNNKYVRDFADQLEQKYEPVYYIELNPALRKSAKKGQQYKAGGIVRKAIGGITQGNNMQTPTLAQMRMQLNQRKNPDYIDTIGIEQAVDMDPKRYISPNPTQNNFMPVGGVADSNGLPVGGIDQDNAQQGQQFMPQQQQQNQDMQPNPSPQGTPPSEQQGGQPPMGNMLSLTPQGQAMQAMGPAQQPPRMAAGGSTKGYVKHEPLKPHPEVGTRFSATPQGNLAKRKKFDIFAQEGKGAILPIPYDATTRDNLVTSVSGHNLTEPLLTEAGFDYSLDKKNLKNKIGGASNLGIASRVQDRVEQAHKEHGGDIYMVPNTMADDAEYFSHHPAHIVLDLLKQRQLNKKTIQQLNDDLRSQFEPVEDAKTGKVIKTYPYKNFLGFDHPAMMEQIMKGGHGLGTTPGKLRTKMMQRLAKVNIQKLLDYNLGDLKASILDPDISTDPKAYMGHTFVKGKPGAALRPGTHGSYDTDYTGTNEGGLGGNRPLEILMPDRYDELHKELIARPSKKEKTPLQMRNQVIGALEKRKQNFAQPINARVINNAGLYEEGLKNGEFDPKNLDSVLAYFKRKGGYKKGGKVSDKTLKDIMKFNVLSKKAK